MSFFSETVSISASTLQTINVNVKKFSFSVKTPHYNGDYNLFLNHCDTLPANIFVWDYFSSGELYANFHLHDIQYVEKDLFSTIYAKHFLNDGVLSSHPSEEGLSPLTFVKSFRRHDDLCWSFPLSPFFVYSDKVIAHPICKYYSTNTSDYTHISPHYSFANLPSNTCSCSHPTVKNFANCTSPIAHNQCFLYEHDSTLICTNSVAISETSSLSFSLHYYLTSSLDHVFEIRNDTDSCIVNQLTYSFSHPYSSLLEDVLLIFNDVLSAYKTFNYTPSELIYSTTNSEPVDKKSYVLSLIGD